MISLEGWVDIRTLKGKGYSIRRIAKELGISRNTVRRHLRSDEPPRYGPRKRRPSKLDPYKDYLVRRLEETPELTATVLLREIRAQGYEGQITILKDFVRPIRAERRRLRELTVRFETAPGEQMQADWGHYGRLPGGAKLYGLVVVLGFSRMLYVHFSTRMRQQDLLVGLVEAFEYFGGWARKLLVDNARSVVLKRGPSVADSNIQPRFLELFGYHGIQLQLCEPARPQTKGKIERSISYVRQSLVMPSSWQRVEEANSSARVWLDTVANVREHGTTGEQPIVRLMREELVAWSSRPPYDLGEVGPRQVSSDCHVSWRGNRYSVPWSYGSMAVLVRRDPGGRLQVERDGNVIAVHRERAGRGKTITSPGHLAGLWSKTLGRKKRHDVEDVAVVLPDLHVERRELAEYEAFLQEAGS